MADLSDLASASEADVKAALQGFPEEKRAKIFRKWKKMVRDKEMNPMGWYKPLPAAGDFHASDTRWRLCTGGNRSSKTYSGVVEMLYWVYGESPYRQIPKGPLTGIMVSEDFNVQEEEVVRLIEELMPRNGCMKLVYTRDHKYLLGPNGKCLFKSDEQGWRSFQSRALDFFWMDEECSYEVYRQLSKRLKGGSKLQGWFTLTPEPDTPNNWTHDELASKALEREPEVAHFKFDLEDNRVSRGGHIADSEIDDLIRRTPVDERPAIIHGEYVRRGGLVYPSWSRDHHLAPEKPLRDFLKGVHDGIYTAFCALDWGVRNPTAVLLLLEDKEGNVHLVDEIYRPAENTTSIKEEFNKRFGVFNSVFDIADPSIWSNHDDTDPTQTIAGKLEADDYERGLRGLKLMKADNDVTNGLEAVRELLRVDPVHGPKLKVQPRCVNFIREIENYVGEEWVTGAYARNKKETPRKKGDHAMDSFRYFALSPHRYVRPRRQRVQPHLRVNPVTGYVRPAVAV